MVELPSGTVTFLFTDIEGSTRLLQQLGERYADMLSTHYELLRAAFQLHGGHEIDTQGDAFFVAFRRANDAIAATIAAQRAIASHPWPEGAVVRVRMGLHTGEPTVTANGYVGLDVHRAARICSAGHGGQVLLSQTTRTLLVADLPSGVSLRDLGPHRLKDLQQPEQIFQLIIPDLLADFPPLKSLDALPNNLPVQLTSFIGREKEMEEVKKLLKTTPLLTLTGVGGCGKTRLAVQVAADLLDEYPDGVWLVELAALADPALVLQAVASALRIREAPGRPLLTTLCDHLQTKKLLLVLDNCEHVIDACAQLAESLLRSSPNLKILATSRELLGLAGEMAWRVPPLSLPDPQRLPSGGAALLPTIAQYETIRLFTERARAALSTFTVMEQNAPALVQICQRLDGIPLAIELAAARVKVLSLEQIASRLDDRFKLLTGGSRTAVRRQQTLQAAIDWSYRLLTDQEQVLLRRLSMFAGGCSLEAAEAICPDEGVEGYEILDLLSQLVGKSLVLKEEVGGAARYRLLETIRQYGQEKLMEAGEAGVLRGRHLEFFLKYAEQAQPALEGPSHGLWSARLETENGNLRAALEWSRAEKSNVEVTLRLAGSLWRFWEVHGHFTEGRRWLEGALAESGHVSAPLRAQALFGAGALALQQGDFSQSAALLDESLTIYRKFGDKSCIARSLNALGNLAWNQGNYATARALYEESLGIRRTLGDKIAIAATLRNLGAVANDQGDYTAAHVLFEESLEIQRELGDQRGIASTLNNLGVLAYFQGDLAPAHAFFEGSLKIRRELGNKQGIAQALMNLGEIANKLGDHQEACSLLEESLAIYRELGDKRGIAYVLESLGSTAWSQGDLTSARARFDESLAIRQKLGHKQGIASVLNHLAHVSMAQGDHRSARALFEESLTVLRQLQDKRSIAASLESFAGLAVAQGDPERAARLFGAAETLRGTIQAPIPPNERADHDRSVAKVRAGLDEQAFAAAWAEGRTMPLEQVVSYALEKGEVP